jgi:hypothetical protein
MDLPFLEYLNYCLKIQKRNNDKEDNYSYWILGYLPEKDNQISKK